MASFNDVVAIFVAEFHTTKGNIIEWSLTADPDIQLDGVEFSVLPSGVHSIDSDVIYFTKGPHQGVAVFRRIKTDEEGKRGAKLISVGVLVAPTRRPRPWRHISNLKRLAVHIEDKPNVRTPLTDYFDEHKAKRLNLGEEEEWHSWEVELSNATMEHPAFHLPHVLRILGISSLTIFKHALGRRRVLIHTQPPVEPACLLAQLAAVISSGEEGESGLVTDRISVLGVVGLIDMPRIERETERGNGWIACTTDAIFLEKPHLYDLVIDLTTPSSARSNRPALSVSRPAGTSNTGKPLYRLQSVRFTWSDFKLWNELDRILDEDEHCDNHEHNNEPSRSQELVERPQHMRRPSVAVVSDSRGPARWIDPWRIYEDVCIVCAGMWTTTSPSGSQAGSSVRLVDGTPSTSVRPSPSTRSALLPVPETSDQPGSSKQQKRLSVDPRIGPPAAPPSTKAIVLTLSLLSNFHNHTAFLLERLSAVLPKNSSAGLRDDEPILLNPRDIKTFDLGPLSDLDARFVEWLAECKGRKLRVKRGWKDLVSYMLGFT